MSICVLVTGVGAPPGLAALRSLMNVENVRLIACDSDPFAAGLFHSDITGAVLPRASDEEHYIARLMALCREHAVDVVLPCSEVEVLTLSKHVELLWREARVSVPVPSHEVCRNAYNKASTYETAAAHGLFVPRTFLSDTADDLPLGEITYPAVVKPVQSQGARGLAYVNSEEELIRTWNQSAREFGPTLVQEFIPGDPQCVYLVGSLAKDGRILTSIVHRKLKMNPYEGGATLAAVTVHSDELRTAAARVLEATGPWHGLVNVEFKVSSEDGNPYLIEINPRYWGFGYLATVAGINFPLLAARMSVGALDEADLGKGTYRKVGLVRSWWDLEVRAEDLPHMG